MRTEASFIWWPDGRPDCSRRPDGRPNFHILVAMGIWSSIWSPGVIWSPIWSPERLVVDLVVVDAVTFGNFWFQVKCVFRNLSVTPNLRRKSWQIILDWTNQSKVFVLLARPDISEGVLAAPLPSIVRCRSCIAGGAERLRVALHGRELLSALCRFSRTNATFSLLPFFPFLHEYYKTTKHNLQGEKNVWTTILGPSVLLRLAFHVLLFQKSKGFDQVLLQKITENGLKFGLKAHLKKTP